LKRFTSAFAGKVYEQMVALIQSRSLKFTIKTFEINAMKTDFLFVGLNLNTIVQEKTPETCTFRG